MKCPECGTANAYVGFNSIECKNSKCKHFRITQEKICPCCGVAGHVPDYTIGIDWSKDKDSVDESSYYNEDYEEGD